MLPFKIGFRRGKLFRSGIGSFFGGSFFDDLFNGAFAVTFVGNGATVAKILITNVLFLELYDELVNKIRNGASTCNSGSGDCNDLAVVRGLFLFDEKHVFSSLMGIVNFVYIIL